MAKKRRLVLFKGDKALWIIISVLFLVSLLVVYSSTAAMAYREVDGNTSYYLMRQLRFIMIGFFTIIVVHRIDYRFYSRYARPLFQLSIILVLLAYAIGISLNDAARWIKIPGTGITFQPSELLKVTLIVLLAQQLGVRQGYIDRRRLLPSLNPSSWQTNPERNRAIWRDMTLPLVVPIAISALVVLPANFSTSAIIFFTCLVMLLIGRVRGGEIWRLIGIALMSISLIVGVMYIAGVGRAETWINRLTQFAQPATESVVDTKQSSQDNFQMQQAEIAIASGSILGKGPGNSTQRSQLPHPYSDFAYAFIIEEYGMFGGMVVFTLYLWIFYRAGLIMRRCRRPSQGLMVLGLSLMITMQAFINMAVSVGLMPVTGQSLPLISMGGTSVIFTCLALGMILGVSRESDQEMLDEAKAEALALHEGSQESTPPETETMPEPPPPMPQPPMPQPPLPIPATPPFEAPQRTLQNPETTPLAQAAPKARKEPEVDSEQSDELTVTNRPSTQSRRDAPARQREVVDLFQQDDE